MGSQLLGNLWLTVVVLFTFKTEARVIANYVFPVPALAWIISAVRNASTLSTQHVGCNDRGWFKGIVTDSKNIFLWHESEHINKKKKLIKISVDSNFTLSSYAWLCAFHCSHRLLCWRNSRVNCAYFTLNWFQPNSFWGIVLLGGELRKYAKNSNFENFESALYSTSVSMP